jgi:hypothetical protein
MLNREDAKLAKKSAPGKLRFPVALAPEKTARAAASDDVVLFSRTARKGEALSSSGLRVLGVFAVDPRLR